MSNNCPVRRFWAREVLDRRRKVLGDAHPDTAASVYQVSRMDYAAGNYRDADGPLGQAITLLRKLQPTDRNLLADAVHQQATNDYLQGRLESAKKVIGRAPHFAVPCMDPIIFRYSKHSWPWLSFYGAGRLAEAIALDRHAVDVRACWRRHARADQCACALGSALSANGEHAEAIENLLSAEQMASTAFRRTPRQAATDPRAAGSSLHGCRSTAESRGCTTLPLRRCNPCIRRAIPILRERMEIWPASSSS